ncbi:S-layer-like y domain-containing protein [Cohnella lubricantis]|uniref:S-layer homology domain-containing protein n=1 Tax=Cohnella lubricantis TaxID=2163172 RepID=A0A841TBT0_9BACL|nr:S-layer homology domain-containing protein [Cohnella lubricantis]MBB6675891.1 S-layer homology domain-containing protein [Cohnella lubricantis]MBP2117192.1 WD40 repeat protein [Cohnella lubricantis]
MTVWKRQTVSLVAVVSLFLSLFWQISASSIASAAEVTESSAYLLNPGFESAEADGAIPGWSIDPDTAGNGTSVVSTVYARTGSQSLLFQDTSNSASPNGRFRVLSNEIAVTGNESVAFSVYAYKAAATDQSHGIQPVIFYYDKDGRTTKLNDFKQYGASQVPVGAWIELSVSGIVPEGTAYIKVGLYSGDPSLTKVYLDDASVTIAPAEAPLNEKIANPGFEEPPTGGAIPGWSLGPGTEGIVELSSSIYHSGSMGLHFKDENNAKNTRVLSDPFAIEGGTTIVTEANVYVISQTHNIVIEFYYYDAAGTQIGSNLSLFSSNSLGSNKWSVMKLQTDVPANAVSARVGLNSGDVSLTEAYFDDISNTALAKEVPLDREYSAPVNLGDMVSVNLGQAAAIQTNDNGDNEVYFITNGNPGTFFAVSLETGESIFSEVIPNTEATWAMTIGEDKNVYFAGTADGILYRYIPTEKRVESLGYNTADNWVWDLATIGGKVYGGTYNSSSDGKVFEYDVATGSFRNYGVIEAGQNYVRGIAVDEDYIYAAMGATVALHRIDRVTGEITEIKVEGYSDTTGIAGDVYVIGDKIFFSASTQKMVVLDKATLEIDAFFNQQAMISEPDPDHPDVIYYVFARKLYQYNMATKQSSEVELPYALPDTPRYKDFAWVTLDSGEKANETVLAAVTQYGETMLVDPQDQWVKFVELDIAANSVSIQSLERGPDGRLYVGGYQRGMSVYNPFTGKIEVNGANFPQTEGIGFLNDYVYYGTYVGAVMYRYDPSEETELNVNPKLVFDIEHQDRPFAIEAGDGKLFVGTVPDYGYLGGALAIYDETADQWQQFNHDHFAPNQSVMSLAYHDGLLFGGTSVWGGLGIEPSEEEAVIFVWDAARNKVVKTIKLSELGLDIDETPRMIGSVKFGPDGLLWGVVDGTIFALNVDDIEHPTIVKSKMLFPSLYNSSKWFSYEIEWAPDGMIYTTLGRKLIALDPGTLQFEVIDETFTNIMTLGIDGSIYYAPDANTYLYRIAVPETDATLSSLTIDGQEAAGFSPGILQYQAALSDTSTVAAEATQDGATVDISRADDGSAVVRVTAADGVSSLAYTITAADKTDPDPDNNGADPDNGSDPGNGSAGNTTTQEVSGSELVANADGDIAIELQAGKTEVILPADASQAIADHPVVITAGSAAVKLSSQVVAAIEALAQGRVSVGVTAAAVDTAALGTAYGANVTVVSGSYQIHLALKKADGTTVEAEQVDGATVAFELAEGADASRVAVYEVHEDGTLSYVGGKIEDGRIEAEIEGAGTYAALQFNKTYSDVSSGHWAEEAIAQLSMRLVAEGVNDTEFAPNQDITRSEFVALIVRALGISASGQPLPFEDVATTSWYAGEVAAAYEAGLVNGKSETQFAPASTISREEMAVIILRAYEFSTGIEMNDSQHSFADADAVSSWALEDLAAAFELGLVNGRGGNQFVPQGHLTRAEAAQAIVNVLELE